MVAVNYLWDEDNVVLETDDEGTTIAEYTYEPEAYGNLISERRDGATYQHHYDALGSTRLLTDEDAQITDTFEYDAWGNEVARIGATDSPFRWAGAIGYYFESGLGAYVVRRRTFLPALSRWTSTDPMRISSNLYMYSRNAPTLYVDPSGLASLDVMRAGLDAFVGPDADGIASLTLAGILRRLLIRRDDVKNSQYFAKCRPAADNTGRIRGHFCGFGFAQQYKATDCKATCGRNTYVVQWFTDLFAHYRAGRIVKTDVKFVVEGIALPAGGSGLTSKDMQAILLSVPLQEPQIVQRSIHACCGSYDGKPLGADGFEIFEEIDDAKRVSDDRIADAIKKIKCIEGTKVYTGVQFGAAGGDWELYVLSSSRLFETISDRSGPYLLP